MSPIRFVTGDGCRALIATDVSFDCRFCASLLGVTLFRPPSTLLLSSVTLTFGPTTAWLPSTPGTKTSMQAESAETRTRETRFLTASSLSLSLGPAGPTKPRAPVRRSAHSETRRGRNSLEFHLLRRRLPPTPRAKRRLVATKPAGMPVHLYPFWGIPSALHFR